jgi:hypothetical protein
MCVLVCVCVWGGGGGDFSMGLQRRKLQEEKAE